MLPDLERPAKKLRYLVKQQSSMIHSITVSNSESATFKKMPGQTSSMTVDE